MQRKTRNNNASSNIKNITASLAAVAGAAAAAPSWGQAGPTPGGGLGGGGAAINISPKAEEGAISPGGVDLRTGRYNYTQTDISIGEGSETGGLTLQRLNSTNIRGGRRPFSNFSHNWDITLTAHATNINSPNLDPFYIGGPDTQVRVNFGSRGETFGGRISGSTENFVQKTRSTFAKLSFVGTGAATIFTMQAQDGTLATFRPLGSNDCSSTPQLSCAYVSSIVWPDGTRYNFEYESPSNVEHMTRLRSVVSSRGYALLLEYAGSGISWKNITKACVLNLAEMPKPSNNNCPNNAVATSTYTYVNVGGKPRLASVTNGANETSSFSYSNYSNSTASSLERENYKIAFIDAGQNQSWMTNTISEALNGSIEFEERVTRQDFADGRHYSYNYAPWEPIQGLPTGPVTPPPQIPPIWIGSYISNSGEAGHAEFGIHPLPGQTILVAGGGSQYQQVGDLKYNITPGPEYIRIIDGSDIREYHFDYCDPNAAANLPATEPHRCAISPLPFVVTDPEGLKTEYLFSFTTKNILRATKLAKPGSNLPNIVTSATYGNSVTNPKSIKKPLTTTDGLGNVTEYTYSPQHGGMLTKTGPADANGVRPQTRYEYTQRYAWLKNASGSYTRAATPVWLLVKEEYCKTTAAVEAGCAGGATDEVVTTYEYESGSSSKGSNLLLLGAAVTADGQTLRTCYRYDQYGRKISETQPRANLASCPAS